MSKSGLLNQGLLWKKRRTLFYKLLPFGVSMLQLLSHLIQFLYQIWISRMVKISCKAVSGFMGYFSRLLKISVWILASLICLSLFIVLEFSPFAKHCSILLTSLSRVQLGIEEITFCRSASTVWAFVDFVKDEDKQELKPCARRVGATSEGDQDMRRPQWEILTISPLGQWAYWVSSFNLVFICSALWIYTTWDSYSRRFFSMTAIKAFLKIIPLFPIILVHSVFVIQF